MKIDSPGFKILAGLPAVLIAATLAAAMTVNSSGPSLSADEQKLMAYASGAIEIKERRPALATAASGKNPFGAASTGKPTTEAERGGQRKGVILSLALSNGNRSMAVINDNMVRPGDTVSGMKIRRIEKNRVLVDDKWIYVEEGG